MNKIYRSKQKKSKKNIEKKAEEIKIKEKKRKKINKYILIKIQNRKIIKNLKKNRIGKNLV